MTPSLGIELSAAFHATTYRVFLTDGLKTTSFDLRIGRVNPVFDEALKVLGIQTWSIVSADNPYLFSKQACTPQQNTAQRQALALKLRSTGCTYFKTQHLSDAGDWPIEHGFLIAACSISESCLLALEFGQAAIVYGALAVAPRVVWTS